MTFLPLPGGLDEDGQVFLGLLLTDVIPEAFGPQGALLGVLLEEGFRHNRLFVNIASKVDAQGGGAVSLRHCRRR